MKIYGPIEEVGLELLAADPSNLPVGRIWYNTVDTVVRFRKDGTISRAVLLNDTHIVIGNSGTVASNVRIHRGGAGLLQFVLATDATAEGSLSNSLAQIGLRTTNYTTAGRPAQSAANVGRLIWDTDLSRIMIDTGAAWVSHGSLIDTDVVTTAKILDLNVTTGKLAASAVTTAKIADNNVTYAKIDHDFIADVETTSAISFVANQPYGWGLNDGPPGTKDYLLFSDGNGYRVNPAADDIIAETNYTRKVDIDDIYLSTSAKRVMQAFKNQAAATITSLGFVAAPTLTATAASDEGTRPWLKHSTGAVANTSTGLVTSNFTQFNTSWDPEFEIAVKLTASQGISRHAFIGFMSASVDGAAANTLWTGASIPAIKVAGFYFYITNTSGPGGDEWSFNPVNSTGVGGAGTATRTMAIGTPGWWYTGADNGTETILRCAIRKAGTEIWYWINNKLVAIHTTNLPSGAIGFGARATTRVATATDIWWSNLTIKHN